ncbi:MAG: hypothetical protein P8M11_11220 [Planctomycetota bacterium]|nr:hypothetical protein [Planctomycetota bacterium]MDG1985132.1 hypothetical protein [Planctomycetota bacterium]
MSGPSPLSPAPPGVWLLAATAALGASCATPGEPLRSPELISIVSYYGGDPIGGSMGEQAALTLGLRKGDAVQISMELWLVSAPTPETAEPLSQHVRLILGSDGPQPIGAHPKVLQGARLLGRSDGAQVADGLAGLPLDEGVRMARFEGLSMPGVATRLSAVFAQGMNFDQSALVDRQFGVELWLEGASAEGLSVALSMRDVIESIQADSGSGELKLSQVQQEEVLVLDTPLALDGDPLVVSTEPSFDLEVDVRVLMVLEARRVAVNTPGLDAELLKVSAEVRDAALEGSSRRQRLRLRERELIRFQESIDALSSPATRRAALLDLASSSKSDLTVDFALLAEEDVLARFAAGLSADRDVLRALASDKEDLAWRLEREVLIELLQGAEANTLGEEYVALLLLYTGDAGRQLGVVEDAIVGSSSIAMFRSRLIEDNKIALESSSSAARVRATDWLASLSVVVPGYDPLGTGSERRNALRQWAAANLAAQGQEAAADPSPGSAGPEPAAGSGGAPR